MKEKFEVTLPAEKLEKLKLAEKLAELEEKARRGRFSPRDFNEFLTGVGQELKVVKREKRKVALSLQGRERWDAKLRVVEGIPQKGEETAYYVSGVHGEKGSPLQRQFFERLPWFREQALRTQKWLEERRERKIEAKTEQDKEIVEYFFKQVEDLVKEKKYYRGRHRNTLEKAAEFGIIKEIDEEEAGKLARRDIVEFWDWPEGKRVVRWFKFSGRGSLQEEVFWALKGKFQREMTACEAAKKERMMKQEEPRLEKLRRRFGLGTQEKPKEEKTEPKKGGWQKLEDWQEEYARKEQGRKRQKQIGKVKGGRRGAKQDIGRELDKE